MMPDFQAAAPRYRDMGMEVFTVGKSAIDVFPCIPFEEFKPATVKRPKVVIFATADTPYTVEAEQAERSARLFGLETEVHIVPDLGGWQDNTHHKATFLNDLVKNAKSGCFCYIDADARFQRYPALLDDFAGDFRACIVDWGRHPTSRNDKELLSGTILFNVNPKTRALFQAWEGLASHNREQRSPLTEQQLLQEALESGKYKAECAILPETYCYIEGLMNPENEPVILQTQKSRVYRQIVGRGWAKG
jgi:hypothetical protein